MEGPAPDGGHAGTKGGLRHLLRRERRRLGRRAGVLTATRLQDALDLAGRVLLALLFLGGFAQKLADPATVQGMIAGIGLPPWLVWPVAAFNLVAGLALVLGPRVRLWALVLAGYCLFTAQFHWALRDDPWQVSIAVKNVAIAGGLLVLAARGPGRWVLFGRPDRAA